LLRIAAFTVYVRDRNARSYAFTGKAYGVPRTASAAFRCHRQHHVGCVRIYLIGDRSLLVQLSGNDFQRNLDATTSKRLAAKPHPRRAESEGDMRVDQSLNADSDGMSGRRGRWQSRRRRLREVARPGH